MHLGPRTSVMTRLLAASAGLAATFALVQAPAQASSRVTVSGIVTSPEAGHPGLDGIRVCAKRYAKSGKYVNDYCRSTTSSGRYSLSLPVATYRFTAEQTHLYGDWVAQSYNSGKAYKVGSAKSVNFQMVRGARISGTLQAPGGTAPGENFLSVRAYPVWSNGKVSTSSSWFSNVGPSGEFKVSKLPAGRYALHAEDNGHEPRLARQWFPNAATATTSTYLTVTSGQQLSQKDMTLSPGSTLRLTIKNPRGKATGGTATIYDTDARPIGSPYLTSGGTVTFTGLHPGQYRARGSSNDVGYVEWFSKKKSFATANPIAVGAGTTHARSFTIHYPTLKATKRPKVRIDLNTVVAKPPTWNKKARTYDIIWYRDGKRTPAPGYDWYSTRRPDVGHRIKACFIARRTGYAEGRSCSKYTKKIKVY
ncbi:hypothetical protein [Aeromicrobium sp. P5_D10]